MVGNHVADLVARYGERRRPCPAALTGYIKGREGYDYSHHGRAGNPHDRLRARRGRRPVLPARPAVGAARAAARSCARSASTSSRSTHARRQGGDDRGLREVGSHPRGVNCGKLKRGWSRTGLGQVLGLEDPVRTGDHPPGLVVGVGNAPYQALERPHEHREDCPAIIEAVTINRMSSLDVHGRPRVEFRQEPLQPPQCQ